MRKYIFWGMLLAFIPMFLKAQCPSNAYHPPYPPNWPYIPYESALGYPAWNYGYLPAGIDLAQHGAYQLVFEDNFDGTQIDASKWLTYEPDWNNGDGTLGARYQGPNHEVRYNDDNVIVTNGKCILTTQYDPEIHTIGNDPTLIFSTFTSGKIVWHQQNADPYNRSILNGAMEARIKMSGKNEAWSTFEVALNNEIDVAEYIGGNWIERLKMTYSLHNWHPEYKEVVGGDHEYGNTWNRHHNLTDWSNNFHIYRAEWDKNFTRFYIDGIFLREVPRLKYNTNPVTSFYPFTNHITDAGYYTQDLKGMDVNTTAYVMMGMGIAHLDEGWPDDFTTYSAQTEIDYIRVYQRDVCTDDVVVTNPILFPYANLNERTIIIGTQGNASQNICGPAGTAWQNISPQYGGHYLASGITMVPNFESFPAEHSTGWNSFLYEAKSCPEERNYDTASEPPIDTFTDIPDTTAYDCDITQADLDEINATEDTDLINRVYFILDSLGCDTIYAEKQNNNNNNRTSGIRSAYSIKSNSNTFVTPGSLSTKGEKPLPGEKRKSLLDVAAYNGEVFLYPNPTKSTSYLEYYLLQPTKVTIHLTNILGQDFSLLIESYLPDNNAVGKHVLKIHSESLVPGLYYCYISIGSETKIKKLTVY